MTDWNTQPLLFSGLGRNKVQADFSGGYPLKDLFGRVLERLKDMAGPVVGFG